MFTIHRRDIQWGGLPFSLETGKIARQASGAVVARYGDTCVLCTVVVAQEPSTFMGFVPLSVYYQEKFYAAGRIPGGFLKRESKPSEQEVLGSRLIDRMIRPLFPKGFCYETQVVCTVISYDPKADPVVAAMNGAAAALALSGAPVKKGVAGLRMGKTDAFVLNPTAPELKESALDLMMAGTREGILMVESQIQELTEETLMEAMDFAHKGYQPVLEMIEQLVSAAGKPKREYALVSSEDIDKKIKPLCEKELQKIATMTNRFDRGNAIKSLKERALSDFDEDVQKLASESFEKLWRSIAREYILSKKVRLDGRALDQVRSISSEVGFLPRTHGSALFTRGETQALVVVTLGGKEDTQLVESLSGISRDAFLLHYNFPPFSVGEVGRMAAPGRREVGHGRLAWRALQAVLPSDRDAFPYSVRIVSEITESYGSSSMATVCASSLALWDAGVPLSDPVAGIAMGLVYDGKSFEVLSDISGTEDSLGDMDFKVTGTSKGVTALQMDIKIDSLSMEMVKQALTQAKAGRLHILAVMAETLSKPREQMSAFAPSVRSLKIPTDRIRDLIGPGGKIIKEICETNSVKIDVDDDGSVNIFGHTHLSSEAAEKRIRMLTGTPTVGESYEGTAVKLIDAGVFVKFGFADDGFVHISEIAPHRVNAVSDVITAGDKVCVKCIGFDAKGRIKLSIRQAEQNH